MAPTKRQIAAYIIIALHDEKKTKKIRSCYANEINLRRNELGEHVRLFQEIKNDKLNFVLYTRMSVDLFNLLLAKVEHLIIINRYTENTIVPEARLAMTLKFLAHGESLQNLAWAFRCGKSTVSLIINAMCPIIWQCLSAQYVAPPNCEQWEEIQEEYNEMWNLPGCVGAIDGKHVDIEAPINSGSSYFNYKQRFSIVFMAVCDAKYKFTLVRVGDVGSSSDGGIFADSQFGRRILDNTLNLPPPKHLPGTNTTIGPYFVGDQAFPLKPNLMRPYPGKNLSILKRTFNYRLSRGRRTIENAFGIFTARWRLFRKLIEANPNNVTYYVLAGICLHNLLLTEMPFEYCPRAFADHVGDDGDIIEGEWRSAENFFQLRDASFPSGQRPNRISTDKRDLLSYYFTLKERTPWQYRAVHSTGPIRRVDIIN